MTGFLKSRFQPTVLRAVLSDDVAAEVVTSVASHILLGTNHVLRDRSIQRTGVAEHLVGHAPQRESVRECLETVSYRQPSNLLSPQVESRLQLSVGRVAIDVAKKVNACLTIPVADRHQMERATPRTRVPRAYPERRKP